MKPIRYCDHLLERLELRGIDSQLPAQLITQPERLFDDTATGYRIAIATAAYGGEDRLMMVVHEVRANEIVAVTTHPLERRDVEAKVTSGRWRPCT